VGLGASFQTNDPMHLAPTCKHFLMKQVLFLDVRSVHKKKFCERGSMASKICWCYGRCYGVMEVHVRLSVINIANVCSCAWHGNRDDVGVMTSQDRLLESFAFLTSPLSRPTASDDIFQVVQIYGWHRVTYLSSTTSFRVQATFFCTN